MKRILTTTAALMLVAWTAALMAADPARERKLQQAIDLMETKGDVSRAVPLLEDVSRSSDKALAARGLLFLGRAQERQGADKARVTYERIVKDFAAQAETAAEARTRLATLGGGRVANLLSKNLLCDACGDIDADFSPDGRLMVFTDWDNDDLAIRDMSTGQVRRLPTKPTSTDDSFPETPAFSPDMKQVAYNWWQDPDRAELRVIPVEPGAKPRVVLYNREFTWYEVAAWFPDGKSILVVAYREPNGTKQLARVSVSDGAVTPLKTLGWRDNSRGSISPDGKYVAYSATAVNPKQGPRPGASDPKDQHVWILAADGSSESEIVKSAGINRDPIWTPDGKHVLFTSDRSGKFDLWSIEVQNGKGAGPTVLIRPDVGDVHAFGFRNGSYYLGTRNPRIEVTRIMDATNPKAKPLETFVGRSAVWSPDGKSIAFKRPHPGGTEDWDLLVRSVDTGEERMYPTTLGFTAGAAARWFRDGTSVMTGLHNLEGGKPAHRIDLKTGQWKALTIPRVVGVELSPDDRTLYSRPNTTPFRIVANDMTTGQERQILQLPVTARMIATGLALSPDGRTLALAWMDREVEPGMKLHLGTVSVDGSNFREVFVRRDTLEGGASVAWSRDGRSIFFNQAQPGAAPWAIMRVPADGSAGASIVTEGPANNESFTLSPDGSRFAISGGGGRLNEVWSLDNVLSRLK